MCRPDVPCEWTPRWLSDTNNAQKHIACVAFAAVAMSLLLRRRQKHSSNDTGKLTPATAISLEDQTWRSLLCSGRPMFAAKQTVWSQDFRVATFWELRRAGLGMAATRARTSLRMSVAGRGLSNGK